MDPFGVQLTTSQQISTGQPHVSFLGSQTLPTVSCPKEPQQLRKCLEAGRPQEGLVSTSRFPSASAKGRSKTHTRGLSTIAFVLGDQNWRPQDDSPMHPQGPGLPPGVRLQE